MKQLTPRQQEEVEWLSGHFSFMPTEEQVSDYIEKTVHGKKTMGNQDANPLFQAKRRLDMTVKMWKEDLLDGLVQHTELRDGTAYMNRLVDSLLRDLPRGLQVNPDLYTGLKVISTCPPALRCLSQLYP